MLALAWALDHFEPYIYGQKLTIRTDNSALSWLKTTASTRGPQARWLERITEFMPFDIQHRYGRLHSNADGLSRIPWRNVTESSANMDGSVYAVQTPDLGYEHNFTLGPLSGWSAKDIIDAQQADSVISVVMQWVDSKTNPLNMRCKAPARNCGRIGRNFNDFPSEMGRCSESGGASLLQVKKSLPTN